jgi:acetylornithine deacetylase/succinyl-diaminopimelate desuccinylase-like protein
MAMNDAVERVDSYLETQQDAHRDRLFELLRIPSISADSRHVPDMLRAAELVRDNLSQAGLDVEIVETDGHPIVYGSWMGATGAPTVLVYGHYDVQPADPLDEWVSPAFEPTIRDGHVYARGATDDKGQFLTHVNSVAAWMHCTGRLPVNVKFVIEGEEEVGSDNLDRFFADNREKLACDVAVVSDTSQFAPGQPAITYGLRGILACEVLLRGPSQDLHSGVFGGAVANPANALAFMIGKLLDAEGRVQIPGFYDGVLPLSAEERERFAQLGSGEQELLDATGISQGCGELGYTAIERRSARPTCDVNGMVSGYTGEGPKTIVPAWASAKISCRLVPDQDPVQLTESLRQFLEQACPEGLQFEFQDYHGCHALVFATDSVWMNAASAAIEKSYGVTPLLIREGGSIPVVSTFRDILGVDTLLLGWGQNTDNLHSPNERFCLDDYDRGTRASAWLWYELSKQSRPA